MTLASFDKKFKQSLPVWIILMLFLGFGFGLWKPHASQSLKSLVFPLSFTMIYMMCIPLRIEAILDVFKRPKELLIALGMSLIFAPLFMWPLGYLFLRNESIIFVGIILASLVPPGGLTAFWAGIMDADVSLALMVEMFALLLSIIWIPFGMKLLGGTMVTIKFTFLMEKILILIIAPIILGYLTRILIVKYKGERGFMSMKPAFSIISGLAALMIVFIALSLKAPAILKHPMIIVLPAIVALLYYSITFTFTGWLTLKPLKIKYEKAVPIVYATGTKNLSIAMALAITAFGPQAILGIVGCSVFQMPIASLYYKHMLKFKPVTSS